MSSKKKHIDKTILLMYNTFENNFSFPTGKCLIQILRAMVATTIALFIWGEIMNEVQIPDDVKAAMNVKLPIEIFLESLPPLQIVNKRPKFTIEYILRCIDNGCTLKDIAKKNNTTTYQISKFVKEETNYDDVWELRKHLKNPKEVLLLSALKSIKTVEKKIGKENAITNSIHANNMLDKFAKLSPLGQQFDAAGMLADMCRKANVNMKITLEAMFNNNQEPPVKVEDKTGDEAAA